MEGTNKECEQNMKSLSSSPTVLDGCMVLSMDFCLFSLSLSLRRWQRWWWWWWCALSWLRTWPAPIEDWVRSGRSRSKSLSLASWWCCVSEDAERLMGLRSTIGWGREEKRPGMWTNKLHVNVDEVVLPKPLVLDHVDIHTRTYKQKIDTHRWHNQPPAADYQPVLLQPTGGCNVWE